MNRFFRTILPLVALATASCNRGEKGNRWQLEFTHAGKASPAIEMDFAREEPRVKEELQELLSKSLATPGDRLMVFRKTVDGEKTLLKDGKKMTVTESTTQSVTFGLDRNEQGLVLTREGAPIVESTNDLGLIHRRVIEESLVRVVGMSKPGP